MSAVLCSRLPGCPAELDWRSDLPEPNGSERGADDGRQASELLASRWMSEHWASMVRTAGKWATGYGAAAEDIAQEALWAAYERRARLVDPAGERAWLLAFVRNKGREAVRRSSRRGERLPEEYAKLGADGNPGEYDDIRRERVLKAARSLPGIQQEIVHLVLDEWRDDEVAASTGLKKGTLWVYKHRAIRKLKRMLDP